MYYICVENNIKIAVEDHNPFSEKVLVFVHGWPFNRKIFENQIAYFSKLGYRCIAFDLRGFGDSDVTLNGYECNQLANDLFYILNTIKHPVTLIGFSTSATFLLRYLSAHHENKVKKLILLSPVFFNENNCMINHENNQDFIYEFSKKANIDSNSLEQFRKRLFATTPAQNIKPYFKRIDWCGSEVALEQMVKNAAKESLKHDFRRIKIPVRVILGKRDVVHPYKCNLALKHKLHNSKLFIMENSGHAVMFDHPIAFNCLLHHCIEN